ncbi:MAG TPA: NosD domain-containing protein [Candidatus Angelobacter sp.]|nr:NosD domain-containing protein [Candidatus Angelobacter sp.]
MDKFFFNRMTLVALAFSALLLCAGRTHATDISGTISTTMTITEDSELVGDVTCMVAGGACISLGSPGIKLRLNGFTITDGANPSNNCASSNFAEDGILVNGQHDVAILGPGLVQKFAGLGISLRASTKVKVKGVTVSDNCFSGIFLLATTDSEIERNISVRNSIGSRGSPCGGT